MPERGQGFFAGTPPGPPLRQQKKGLENPTGPPRQTEKGRSRSGREAPVYVSSRTRPASLRRSFSACRHTARSRLAGARKPMTGAAGGSRARDLGRRKTSRAGKPERRRGAQRKKINDIGQIRRCARPQPGYRPCRSQGCRGFFRKKDGKKNTCSIRISLIFYQTSFGKLT